MAKIILVEKYSKINKLFIVKFSSLNSEIDQMKMETSNHKSFIWK